jgi:hypothetical protein
MTDVDAIRAAIGAIADEAHPPQRVRAVLDARTRYHKQRRLLLRAAGVVAAATATGAGGVAVYRLSRSAGTAFPEIVGGPGGGWLRVALRWRPDWLPEGHGTTSLGAVIDGTGVVSAVRTWTPPQRPDGPNLAFVSLASGWSDVYAQFPTAARTDRVDIGGVPGELSSFDSGAVLLSWQPAGQPRLSVSVGVDDGDAERERDIAVRVARSLRPDPGTFAVGPRPGSLPGVFAGRPWLYTLKAEGTMWTQSVLIRNGDADLEVWAAPDVRPLFDIGGAQPIDIDGARAWLDMRDHGLSVLFVEQLDNRDVQVSTTVDGVDLPQVVREFDLGPVPDMTWYGSQ